MKYRNDMGKEKDFSRKSDLSQLSDDEILQGFKDANKCLLFDYSKHEDLKAKLQRFIK